MGKQHSLSDVCCLRIEPLEKNERTPASATGGSPTLNIRFEMLRVVATTARVEFGCA